MQQLILFQLLIWKTVLKEASFLTMINKSRTPPFEEKKLLCISPNLVMSERDVKHLQRKMQAVEPE